VYCWVNTWFRQVKIPLFDQYHYIDVISTKVDFLIWSQNLVIGQNSKGGKTLDTVKPVWRRAVQRLISLFSYKMLWLAKYDVTLRKSTERWLVEKSHTMCGPVHSLYSQTSFGLSRTRREKKNEERRKKKKIWQENQKWYNLKVIMAE